MKLRLWIRPTLQDRMTRHANHTHCLSSRSFEPLEPINLAENTPVTVALLDSDDLSAEALAELGCNRKAFDFLDDPREDVYSESDGEATATMLRRAFDLK